MNEKPSKEQPIIFYLTRKDDIKIRRVITTKVSPRYVWIRHHWGNRRERLRGLYGNYHTTFLAAKNWIRVEFEAAAVEAKKIWDKSEDDLRRVNLLEETDTL